jgi:Peptidase inhibitor family I36
MHKPSKRIWAIMTVVAFAVPSVAFSAAPAQAAGQLCTYSDRDARGDRECTSGYVYLTYNNNRVSSIWNFSGSTFCVYDSPYSTPSLTIGPGHHYANLAWDSYPGGGSWNDRISVVRVC